MTTTTIDFRALANRHVEHLVPYQPGKPLEELGRELGIYSAVKLASNENPLGVSEKAITAAKEAIFRTDLYPDGGYYELKKTLSAFLNIPATCITVGNGSENILELIAKSYLAPGDAAVVSEYVFLTIPILISSYGATLRVAKALSFGSNVEAMVDAIDDKTRVLFLVNPNNPTGTYTSDAEFQYLMDRVPAHVLVVVDEAYIEYIEKDDYPNAIKYLARYPNLIISRTFSKAYGMAGMRLGYAVSSLEIADILNRARLPFNVNSVAASAGIAALSDHEHLQKTIALNKRVLAKLLEGIRKLGLPYIPSVANFLTIDVGDGVSVYEKLLRQGVIVRPLKAYNLPCHIRVSTGTEEQNHRFLEALPHCL